MVSDLVDLALVAVGLVLLATGLVLLSPALTVAVLGAAAVALALWRSFHAPDRP